MKTKLLKVSALAATIQTIGSQRVQLDADVQQAAIQCVGQSIVHRNVTPSIALFDALGKSARRDSLVKWFETYGAMSWSKDQKKLIFHAGARKFDDEAVAIMSKNMWYDAKKAPEPTSIYDLDVEVGKFLDRIKRVVSDKGRTVANRELFDVVNTAYLRYVVAQADDETKAQGGKQSAHANTQELLEVTAGEQSVRENGVDVAAAAAALADHFGKPQVKVAA